MSTSTTSTSTTTTSTSTTTTSTTSTTSTSTTISPITIEDIRTGLDFRLQDDSEKITPTEIDLAIDQASRIYSKDRPLKKIKEDITANGSKFDFDLPYDWAIGFSYITGDIEYPVSDDIQTPQYVDSNNWMIYKKVSGEVLRFLVMKPSSSYAIRYEYLIPHTISDENCTVYERDVDAVCDLAAALVFKALAAKHAETEEPTIEADVIDYVRKSDQYMELAKESFRLYNDHIGAGEDTKEKPGAMAMKDFDINIRGGNLTHPRELR